MSDQENYDSAKKALELAIEKIKNINLNLNNARVVVIQKEIGIPNTHPNLTGFCGFAERILGWIPLNPNNIERTKALISIYYIPGFDQDTFPEISLECPHPITNIYGREKNDLIKSKLPSKEGMRELFNIITSVTPNRVADRLTLISGKRGSGKTMALNFFLTTAHKKLSENGVVWFRTDIARLWGYKDTSLTLTSYTIFHSIYVALKYPNEDLNLKAFSDGGKDFGESLSLLKRGDELRRLWDEIVISFNDSCRVTSFDFDPKALDQFLYRCNHLIEENPNNKFYLGVLFGEFIYYLRAFSKKNGFNLISLIILDGFDNIRVGAHQDRYYSFLREVNKIVSEPPINTVDKFIIVARPETIEDFYFVKTIMPNGAFVSRKFEMEALFIDKLLLKRKESIENPVEFYQRIAKSFMGSNLIDSVESDSFKETIDFLVNRFERSSKIFNKCKTIDVIFETIDVIFDGNIRSLLRNCIRAHHHKKSLGDRVPSNRSLFEGSILAGCKGMPENFDESIHGHWCPNLFEHAIIENGQWNGLSIIRLLQLMSAINKGTTREEAFSFLQKEFGYSKAVCESAFQVALEFSLIRICGHKLGPLDEDIARPLKNRLYHTTVKGKYILHIIFNDYGVFYYMALATPLDIGGFFNKKIINILTHSSDIERHFYRAVIFSGLILWKHIYISHLRENNALNNKLQVGNEVIDKSNFILKDIGNWPNTAINLLNKLYRQDILLISENILNCIEP